MPTVKLEVVSTEMARNMVGYAWLSSIIYVGHWKMTLANGDVYEGEYSDGKKQGWISLMVPIICRALEGNICRGARRCSPRR